MLYILINIYVITIWVKPKIKKCNVETRFLVGYKVIYIGYVIVKLP